MCFSPKSAEISLQLALCLHKLGELAEARIELQSLLGRNEANAPAWFALGLVCQELHDIQPAIAAYRKSLELRPRLAEAHVNLGICLQATSNLTAAKSAYAVAMQLRPDTFGRIAQALPSAAKGELWLDPERLRQSLGGRTQSPGTESPPVNSRPA